MVEFKSDIEIARQTRAKPIAEIAAKLDIPAEHLIPYGHDKAKISDGFVNSLGGNRDGKLVLVTAINPTPAGEGKTTTTIGLGDALARTGHRVAICLREASLGPCFGQKGGATGGGRAQVIPMEDINLHFTGDFHAITSAHNLLAAMVDNHVHWGNALGIDPRRIAWRRVMDVNDRALRQLVAGLGGPGNGYARETGFDITAASEIMAILCLTDDRKDLERRLGNIVVAARFDRTPVFARELQAEGAMAVLLRDAIQPNLVQTLEHTPVLIHGGPFANIAHGCNSVIATRTALKLADVVVTEAGFGADLGAEKFFDIKCRQAGLAADAAVIVATVRAMKLNGGATLADLDKEDVGLVEAGCANLGRHIENVRQYGVPVAVAINHFHTDTDAEIAALRTYAQSMGAEAVVCRHWAHGSEGAIELAETVTRILETEKADFAPIYSNDAPLFDKIETVVRRIYRGEGVVASKSVLAQLQRWQDEGYGHLPVCLAKTQYSFSTDPTLVGAPEGHVVPVREVRLAAGAGFVVAVCGDMLTMPGLPRRPAAERIRLSETGEIDGLS
ncbi:formate--tetrahydrofolate ligase [Consotaella aegiceratis]|uniref:formate--tetrahydrofolate ligase n=1 Tax=Consotaella aegiceratis TaxID=3097961 RepID=UPI002F4017E0